MLWPARQRKQVSSGAIPFQGFPHGLNTAIPAAQITATELSTCVNWKVNKGGQLETRRPVVQYSNSATTGTILSMADVPIGSATYKLLSDSIYRLYYLDSSLVPIPIGTAEGDVEIISYNGYAIILDGSYIKYLDGMTPIKIAYDAGTGSSGFQLDKTAESDDASLALGNGTNVRVAQKFTSQAWDELTDMYGIAFDAQTGSFTVGNTITGAESGATATINVVDNVNGTLGLTGITGTFQDNEVLYESAVGSELITAQNDRDFSTGTIGNWVLSTTGSGTLAYDGTNPGAEKVGKLTAAGDELFITSQLLAANAGATTAGYYIATISCYVPVANTEKTAHVWTGDYTPDKEQLLVGDTWTEISYVVYLSGVLAAGDNAVGVSLYAPSAGDILYHDDQSFKRVTNAALADGTVGMVPYGYTIPPITVAAYLSKTLAPTGSITASIRKVSDDSVIATKTFLSDVTSLTGVSTEFDVTFASTDITNEMLPSTAYYCSLEYSGGDAANYVNVHTTTVASGGLAYHYIAAWVADTTSDCLMSLSPGRPPKGSFGVVHNARLYVGGDPDNPGYVWYGNLSHLDWSSTDGGGYVGAVDDNRNNFEVGGLATLFNDLYIYGTETQSYLAKLTGDSPSEYTIPALYQNAWTLTKTLKNAKNDIWSANSTGVDSLSGVQEYGDIRTFSYSDPIKDRIDDYWASTAFAGYYPEEGQYWLYMADHHRILVCHTKTPSQSPDGLGVRYPWSEYELCRGLYTTGDYIWQASGSGDNEYYLTYPVAELFDEGGDYIYDESGSPISGEGASDPSVSQPDFITLDNKLITEGTAGALNDHQWDYADNDTLGFSTLYIRDESGNPTSTGVEIRSVMAPSCFGTLNNKFMIGSGGYVYEIDITEYKELTTERIYFDAITAYPDFPLTYVNLNEYQINTIGVGGGELDVLIYKDGYQDTAALSFSLSLNVDDRLTINDLTMDVDDAYFLVNPVTYKSWRKININARSVQVQINNVKLGGYPVFLNGHLLKYRSLSY